MIVALPCPHFDTSERRIVNEHGFMSFPQFIDNKFTYKARNGQADVKWLEKQLARYGCGLVHFAVSPDLQYGEATRLREKYPDVSWIFPLHDLNEPFSDWEWIGYPHMPSRRNYALQSFLDATKGKRRWYLGFWDEAHPEFLREFDGFDTTLPETYSGKYGKLWLDWGRVEKSSLVTIETFEFNVLSLKHALMQMVKVQHLRLSEFILPESPVRFKESPSELTEAV